MNLLEEDSIQGRKIETGFVGDQLGIGQLFHLGCSSTVNSLWRLMQAAQLSFFCVPIGRPYTVMLSSAFQQLLHILKVSKAGGAEMNLREG